MTRRDLLPAGFVLGYDVQRFVRNLVFFALSLTVIFVWAYGMLGLPLILWLNFGWSVGWAVTVMVAIAIIGTAGFATFLDGPTYARIGRWIDGR